MFPDFERTGIVLSPRQRARVHRMAERVRRANAYADAYADWETQGERWDALFNEHMRKSCEQERERQTD